MALCSVVDPADNREEPAAAEGSPEEDTLEEGNLEGDNPVGGILEEGNPGGGNLGGKSRQEQGKIMKMIQRQGMNNRKYARTRANHEHDSQARQEQQEIMKMRKIRRQCKNKRKS